MSQLSRGARAKKSAQEHKPISGGLCNNWRLACQEFLSRETLPALHAGDSPCWIALQFAFAARRQAAIVPVMKLSVYTVGMTASLLILLAGGIVHTLYGSAAFGSDHAWGNDDAYISYRYAENLAHGNGLVFNRGEKVEGYSNFLYVVLMAPAFFLTDRDGIYFFSVFLNLVFAAGALLLFGKFLRAELGETRAVMGSLLVALCLPWWVAVASGLETSLVLLLTVAIWVRTELVVRDDARPPVVLLSLLMILSLLARADGFVVPLLAILYMLLQRRFRAAVACGLPLAASWSLYEVWRYHYYGYLLPNTYYVKVVGSLPVRLEHAVGQLAIIAFMEGFLPYLLILSLAAVIFLVRVSKRAEPVSRGLRFDVLLGAGWTAYWLYIGGDHFLDRFLLILCPLGIYALFRFFSGRANTEAVMFVVVLIAILQIGPPWLGDPRFHYRVNKYDCWITVGKFLKEKYPGKSLATAAIGKVPFFSGAYTIDELGLADSVIAHESMAQQKFDPGHTKYDPDYVLSRQPDLIVEWLTEEHDLAYGITKSKYEKAGYQLSYLFCTNENPPPIRVVAVTGRDDQAIEYLRAHGYNYAVVEKR